MVSRVLLVSRFCVWERSSLCRDQHLGKAVESVIHLPPGRVGIIPGENLSGSLG
jgi:hypothetical protein